MDPARRAGTTTTIAVACPLLRSSVVGYGWLCSCVAESTQRTALLKRNCQSENCGHLLIVVFPSFAKLINIRAVQVVVKILIFKVFRFFLLRTATCTTMKRVPNALTRWVFLHTYVLCAYVVCRPLCEKIDHAGHFSACEGIAFVPSRQERLSVCPLNRGL